jgi:hypothetical protein
MRNLTLAILLLAAPCPVDLLAQVGGTLPPMGWTAEVMPPLGGTNPGPLSELLAFHVEVVERTVELRWHVALERNAAAYKVERSADALLWEEVASVAAQGTAYEPLHYLHHDHPTLPGTWYYRLRGVDEQGTGRFGQVVPVWFQPRQEELLLWPNPATHELNVVQNERHEPIYYRIYDPTGHMLVEGWLTPEERRVDVRMLPQGMHSLVLSNSAGVPIGSAQWLKE